MSKKISKQDNGDDENNGSASPRNSFVDIIRKKIVHCSKVGTAEELRVLMKELRQINRKNCDLTDVTDSYGDSCLHVAAIRSRPKEVLEILLDEGKIDVDVHDDDEEETPTFWAARAGANHLIEFFFERGADLAAENKYGDSVMEVAEKCGKFETAAFLQHFMEEHSREIAERRQRRIQEQEEDLADEEEEDDFYEEVEEEESDDFENEEEEEEEDGKSDVSD